MVLLEYICKPWFFFIFRAKVAKVEYVCNPILIQKFKYVFNKYFLNKNFYDSFYLVKHAKN
jgi:hypothetical protein